MSVVFVGSLNPVKVRAVGRGLDGRPDLSWWSREALVACGAKSKMNEQPTSLEETVEGARNRARWCRQMRQGLLPEDLEKSSDELDLFVGIESGTLQLGDDTLDLCVAWLEVDGHHSVATSSSFCLPPAVAGLLSPAKVAAGYNLDHACRDAGLTKSNRLGGNIGLVGLLSKGVLTREDYTFEAFRNALFTLDAG